MMRPHKTNRLFRAVLAVVIVIILIVAAEIKIIYPSKLLHDFFFFISIIEIALALAVASFWNRWKTWALVALVFATWGGYSLYPAIFGLPCYCLGVAVDLPKGTSLAVNLLMVILSWVVLRDFGISRQRTIRLILLSFVLAVIGFACAAFLYSTRL